MPNSVKRPASNQVKDYSPYNGRVCQGTDELSAGLLQVGNNLAVLTDPYTTDPRPCETESLRRRRREPGEIEDLKGVRETIKEDTANDPEKGSRSVRTVNKLSHNSQPQKRHMPATNSSSRREM